MLSLPFEVPKAMRKERCGVRVSVYLSVSQTSCRMGSVEARGTVFCVHNLSYCYSHVCMGQKIQVLLVLRHLP